MSDGPTDQHLRELLDQTRRSKIRVIRALELAQPHFPEGRLVKAQLRLQGDQSTLDVLFLVEVQTEKGLMLAPKEVRVNALTGAVSAGDPEKIDEEDARAIVASFPNFTRNLYSFRAALSTGEREVTGGVAVDVRLGGRGEHPELYVALATDQDAVTLRLDARSGEVLGRASWRDSLREAAAAFRRFESLGREFDPNCADFYADGATIRNARRMPDGETRKMEMGGSDYRKMIVSTLSLARERGDRNTFRGVDLRMEGCGVRVRASRFSELKQYESPIDWLFARDENGRWRIVEENSISQP